VDQTRFTPATPEEASAAGRTFIRETLAQGIQAFAAAAGGVRNEIPNRLKAFINPIA
jgi:hypothetical protein